MSRAETAEGRIAKPASKIGAGGALGSTVSCGGGNSGDIGGGDATTRGSGDSTALPLPLSILGVEVGVGDLSPSDMTSKTVSLGLAGFSTGESALTDLRWISLKRSAMRSETLADRSGTERMSCGCNRGDVVYLSPYTLLGANLALVTKLAGINFGKAGTHSSSASSA